MQLTNLNIFTILIFLAITWVVAYLWYQKYLMQNKFNNYYKLLAKKDFFKKYIILWISFIIILFWIFGIKYWEKQNAWEANWIDMMFVLDVSKSMNVADISDSNYNYTRLDVAKAAISKYVANHRENRYWLVIFAWDAISTIPLTTDTDLFLTFLKWVDYRNLTVQGSDFNKALDLAINRFNTSDDRSKALVFISDWWDDWDYRWLDIVIPKNISYFVVGVWTKSWWRIIKNTDPFWRPNYQKYKWQYVISKLNTDNLEQIADKLDWDFFIINKASDLYKLDKKINSLEKKSIKKWTSWELADYSRNLVILSFILFIVFMGFYLFENKKWKKH